MNQLNLRDDRLEFKTSRELYIILEESMEYALKLIESPSKITT